MQIGSKSNTYLKQIQSRAKMHEYHVAEKDYVQIEEKAQWIIISAIDIICEFAEEIIESEANIQMDWKKYMVKLRFAMRFFDSFSKSELAGGNVEYFELLGSAIYYLGGRNGSSKVMADNISDDLDLECSSIDKTLLAILRMDKEYEYEGTNELLIEIVAELKRSLNYGDQFNYKNLKKFREEVYLYGSNREVIFSDILIAVIYLKLYNSAYCLLPLYTGVEKKIWKDILNRNTLVKELWAAQKELGENDIFRGKSATIQMPTGSGKTKSIALIIESAFLMQRTTEVMIVTPFRSLCREITDELSNAFSYTENISVTAISDILQEDYIGVLERYEMPIYNIYVLTPEKLSFMIRQSNDVMKNVGLIIFDEGHLFDDLHRGMQYELLVSLIKNQLGEYVQTILISAVLPNAYEINEWLTESEGSIVKNNAIVTTEKTISFAEEKNNTIYLHFVDSENPEVEDFYVPRVITPQELETSKREKRKVFPDLKKSNDVSIFVKRNMRTKTIISPTTGRRTDRTDYPITAVREAIINALVHRDYSIHTEGMPIQLIMFEDRIEIHNPGGLYGRITIDQLGKIQPDTRNPLLASALETLGITENRYSGIPTIRMEMEKYNLRQPEFLDERGSFIVKLYKESKNDYEDMSNDEETNNLIVFCKTPRTRKEICDYLGLNSVTYAIQTYVNPLVEAGVIKLSIPDKPKSPKQLYYSVEREE